MSATTKTYYLPTDLVAWVEEQAKRENRSASNYLATKLLELKAQEEVTTVPTPL